MDATPKPPMKRIAVRLAEKRHEYDDVYSYFFDPEEPIAYGAGQYVHVALPITVPDAKPVRELSFASAPHEKRILFTIDSRSQSPFQQHLQTLREGDTMDLFKTNRHMRWPVIEEHVVFIAGGIGVTPFRSMVLDMKEAGIRTASTLVHVARESYLYETELKDIVDAYHQVTRESLDAKLRDVLATQPHARYFVAGSPAFVEAIESILKNAGVERIETDAFKGYVEE